MQGIEWRVSGEAQISLELCRNHLLSNIKALQSKYPQYEGLYDGGHGWKLATVVEPIRFKGKDILPGMLIVARPEIMNGEVTIHAETVVDDSIAIIGPSVWAWRISGEEVLKIYFLEK